MKKTEPRLGVNKGAQVTTSTTAVKTSLESNFFFNFIAFIKPRPTN